MKKLKWTVPKLTAINFIVLIGISMAWGAIVSPNYILSGAGGLVIGTAVYMFEGFRQGTKSFLKK